MEMMPRLAEASVGPLVAAALIAADDVRELGAFAVGQVRKRPRQVFSDGELTKDARAQRAVHSRRRHN